MGAFLIQRSKLKSGHHDAGFANLYYNSINAKQAPNKQDTNTILFFFLMTVKKLFQPKRNTKPKLPHDVDAKTKNKLAQKEKKKHLMLRNYNTSFPKDSTSENNITVLKSICSVVWKFPCTMCSMKTLHSTLI